MWGINKYMIGKDEVFFLKIILPYQFTASWDKLPQVSDIHNGEAVLWLSMSPPHQGDTESGKISSSSLFSGISLKQPCHITLEHAFDQVKITDGQQIQSNVVHSNLYLNA